MDFAPPQRSSNRVALNASHLQALRRKMVGCAAAPSAPHSRPSTACSNPDGIRSSGISLGSALKSHLTSKGLAYDGSTTDSWNDGPLFFNQSFVAPSESPDASTVAESLWLQIGTSREAEHAIDKYISTGQWASSSSSSGKPVVAIAAAPRFALAEMARTFREKEKSNACSTAKDRADSVEALRRDLHQRKAMLEGEASRRCAASQKLEDKQGRLSETSAGFALLKQEAAAFWEHSTCASLHRKMKDLKLSTSKCEHQLQAQRAAQPKQIGSFFGAPQSSNRPQSGEAHQSNPNWRYIGGFAPRTPQCRADGAGPKLDHDNLEVESVNDDMLSVRSVSAASSVRQSYNATRTMETALERAFGNTRMDAVALPDHFC